MVKKRPVVDIGRCTLCKGCIEVAPNVFRYNTVLNYIEVIEKKSYPEQLVDEAIKNCPADCIEWDDDVAQPK